jgi:hypothetical protein
MKRFLVPFVLMTTHSIATAGPEPVGVEIVDTVSGSLVDGETELNRGRDCDPAVVAVYQVQEHGILWYEAEDANGNRFVVTNVVGAIGSGKGVVDFGDGTGGHFVQWAGVK